MTSKLMLAAATDEFAPDLDTALRAMREIGIQAAEIRSVNGRGVLDAPEDELRRARQLLDALGMQAVLVSTPVMKCVLPTTAVDPRFDFEVMASPFKFEDQPRLSRKAFEAAKILGAKCVRVFSFYRAQQPLATHPMLQRMLAGLAAKAAEDGLSIALQNDPACNVATAGEAAQMLGKVDHPNLKLIWDPVAALEAGDKPFPEAYVLLPAARIAAVSVRDCRLRNGDPEWVPVGTGDIDWKGLVAALIGDGFRGWLSLDSQWPGPANDKLLGARISGWNLRSLASQ
jgi:sugar phosphate isomerase/epimerase